MGKKTEDRSLEEIMKEYDEERDKMKKKKSESHCGESRKFFDMAVLALTKRKFCCERHKKQVIDWFVKIKPEM